MRINRLDVLTTQFLEFCPLICEVGLENLSHLRCDVVSMNRKGQKEIGLNVVTIYGAIQCVMFYYETRKLCLKRLSKEIDKEY